MIRHILVVCVGNICRSPMAEALLREALRGQEEITVESAGLGALVGHPADEHAVELMSEQGVDITAHRARQLHPDMVAAADLILVMETGHKTSIDTADPTVRGKVYRICEWQGRDVPDPYRQPREAFEEALGLIEQGVQEWAERI